MNREPTLKQVLANTPWSAILVPLALSVAMVILAIVLAVVQ